MKKSLLTMTAAVALVGAMGAGATLAYFSAQTEAVTNKFTFAQTGIAITLEEHAYVQETNSLDTTKEVLANTYDLLVPGMTVPKDPYVTVNKGSVDCYVVVEVVNDNAGVVSNVAFDTKNWTKLEGEEIGTSYWRYNEKVTRNADVDQVLPAVFTEVTFNDEITAANTEIKDIVITAAATQAQEREEAEAIDAAFDMLKK